MVVVVRTSCSNSGNCGIDVAAIVVVAVVSM